MRDLEHSVKWNLYYDSVGKLVPWGYNVPDLHIINFIKYYGPIGNKVLDVGCGYGKNSIFFIDMGMNYIGIDISKTAILDASKKYRKGKFICNDFLEYNFEQNYYDFILDAGCIHVNDPYLLQTFLDKYFSLLVKGGKLFIRVFKNCKDENIPLFYIDNILPVWGYTEARFLSYIDDKKFTVDKIILDKYCYEEDEVFYFYLRKI